MKSTKPPQDKPTNIEQRKFCVGASNWRIEKECVIMTKTELRSATSAANKIIKLTSAVRKDYAGCFRLLYQTVLR